MNMQTAAAFGAGWLWEQYGKTISDKAADAIKRQWARFHWRDAETRYRKRLEELYSTTQILGYPTPISVADIYTDIYVTNKLTAIQRYDINELQSKSLERESIHLGNERGDILSIALSEKPFYVLGKPGSGKTTLLKHLILQACVGKIDKTPIFISLKEWSDAKLSLPEFISQQFEICQFPNADTFISILLKRGRAFVMFDGLDEVSQESGQQSDVIRALENFSKKYSDNSICITCRNAASNYMFDRFTYVEIAEFSDEQIHQYAQKWYQNDEEKLDVFLSELYKPDNAGLKELACTPLLLALLCLTYDEIGYFPTRRVELYKEAIDAMLKKWDASRGIKRDDIYRKLSVGRREQLLIRLAAYNFEKGVYFFKQDDISNEIVRYVQQLPPLDIETDTLDGEAILKAIEAQHGLLVERARGIYSFSHLSFQEYFTARYIIENSADGTLERLISGHLADNRWREVFLLTASLLYEADSFFGTFIKATERLIQKDNKLLSLLIKINRKSKKSKWPGPGTRSIILWSLVDYFFHNSQSANLLNVKQALHFQVQNIAIRLTRDQTSVNLGAIPIHLTSRIHHFDTKFASTHNLEISTELGVEFSKNELSNYETLLNECAKSLADYLRANLLLLDCLELAMVSDRLKISEHFLVPPYSID